MVGKGPPFGTTTTAVGLAASSSWKLIAPNALALVAAALVPPRLKMPRSVCPGFRVSTLPITPGASFAALTEALASFAVVTAPSARLVVPTPPVAIFCEVTAPLFSLLVVTTLFFSFSAVTAPAEILLLSMIPAPRLPGSTAFGPSLPATTALGAILPAVTACLRIAFAVTAPFLIWFGPTLFLGSPAAIAAPPRAMNRANDAITFAYVSRGRNRFILVPPLWGFRWNLGTWFQPLRSIGHNSLNMDSCDLIWKNGEFVPWDDAKVHVLSHGLHYGTGVFEGIRAYDTERGPAIFRAQEHSIGWPSRPSSTTCSCPIRPRRCARRRTS